MKTNIIDEHTLIVQLRNGSHAAFEILYNHYWQQVSHFVSLYINDTNVGREIIQDVFIKLWQSKHLLNECLNLKGYLFIITRNLIFDKSRANKLNNRFVELTINDALEHSYQIGNDLDAQELEDAINELIDQMPIRRREVFILSRKENLSYKEIASKLNISPQTVERHINESIRFIKRHLLMYIIFSYLLI